MSERRSIWPFGRRQAHSGDLTDANPVERAAAGAPRWLWVGTLVVAVWLALHATVGVVLAMVGWYETWATSALSLVGTAALIPLVAAVARTAPTPPDGRRAHGAALAVVVIACGLAAYSADHIGQHVITQRDPGSYTTTARWLSRTGELRSDVSAPELEAVEAQYLSPAVYEVGPAVVEPQFAHGPGVLLATAFDVAGQRALFAAAAAVGGLALLGLYLVLTTVSRSVVLAVAATTAVGVSAPFVYVTRNTYSEPFVMAALLPAIAIATGARGRWPRANVVVVALLIGATMGLRIDAQLYVIALAVLVALLVAGGRLSGRSAALALGVAAVFALVGAVDVRVFTGDYFATQRSNVRLLDLALAVAVGGVLVVAAVPSVRRRLPLAGAAAVRLAPVAAGLAVVTLLGLWLVRPLVHDARADWEPTSDYALRVEGLQMLEGLEVDGLRSYGELSVRWLSWYLGPGVIALAVIGFGLIAYRACRGDQRALVLAVFTAIGVPVYLWAPNITPEHLWATRRFIPLIVPCFVVAAVVAADALLARVHRRPLAGAAALVLGGAFVAGAAIPSWPIRQQADQQHFYPSLVAYCWHIGAADAVLQLGDGSLGMATRAWCGVPAGWLSEEQAGAGGAPYFVAFAGERCAAVRIVAETSEDIIEAGVDASDVQAVGFENLRHVEPTLTRRPAGYIGQRVDVVIARFDPPPGCRPSR